MRVADRFAWIVIAAIFLSIAAQTKTAAEQAQRAVTFRFPTLPLVSPEGVRNDLPNPYSPGIAWGILPSGRRWGSTASVTMAPDGRIWVVDRCGTSGAGGTTCGGTDIDPIFEFDSSGNLLRNFGRGLFISPHKLTVDQEGNLWVADNGLQDGKGNQVFKLSPTGQVLLTLGRAGVAGPGNDTFDQPTEVAVAPNGDIFVADGHGRANTANARIVKFDKTGKFIKAWGKKGTNVGEFDCVHTLAFDSRGRLFVGDRQNNRIQIFDQDGTFIAEWKQFGRPSGIYIDKNDVMYVSDSESRDGEEGYGYNPGVQRGIRIGSARTGVVQYLIPDVAPYPYKDGWPMPDSRSGLSSMAEGVTADALGNVYGAEFLMDLKKYSRK